MATRAFDLCRNPDARQPVIVAARRTPIGRAGGLLRDVEASALLAPVLRAVRDDAGIAAPAIDDIIIGNAAGGGGNIARLAGLRAGLPVDVPGMTVDRQCGSGLEAVALAANLVAAGAGDIYLAGGVESVSTAPWRVEKPRKPGGMPRFYGRARFSPDEIGDPEMGEAAENVARRYGIDRARQDAFALQSHHRAVAAADAGRFDAEIVPVETPRGSVTRDECPRRDTSADALARLSPAFDPAGTVTAGNACPLNDGAAVVAVTSLEVARRLGLENVLAFAGAGRAGVDPNLLGIGPVASTRKLRERGPDIDPAHVDAIEFNEAFAAQVLASLDLLGVPSDRVNRDGGAIALGHPYGASGAILVVRLFSQLVRGAGAGETDGATALAMIGIGGGLGITALFQAGRIA
jgi:acetyl-CoA C-acetyltransferase